MFGSMLKASGNDGLVSGPTVILPSYWGFPVEGSVKVQVPSDRNVNVNVSPGLIEPLSKEPSSAVTL